MPTTWNPADNSDATLSNGNLTASFATTPAYHACRATTFKNTGKLYFEDILVASPAPDDALWLCGVSNSSENINAYPGLAGGNSVGFQTSGNILFDNVSHLTSWSPAAIGDVIAFAIDIDNGLFWVKDVTSGSVWNITGDSADPATGVGGINISAIPNMLTTGITIMCAGYFSGVPETHLLNTGASAFVGAVPSGFAAWDPSGAADNPPFINLARAAAMRSLARPAVAWNIVLGTGIVPLSETPDEVRYNPLPLWGPLLAQ